MIEAYLSGLISGVVYYGTVNMRVPKKNRLFSASRRFVFSFSLGIVKALPRKTDTSLYLGGMNSNGSECLTLQC